MKILGIDPGIARIGWGLIEKRNTTTLTPLSYGLLTTEKKETEEDRLATLFSELTTILKETKPDEVAIEKLFFAANAKTAFTVGQARGVIIVAISLENIPIHSYTPLQVKMALTGYGRADKVSIQKMVQSMLKLKTIPQPDDTADALAIAITHAVMKTFSSVN